MSNWLIRPVNRLLNQTSGGLMQIEGWNYSSFVLLHSSSNSMPYELIAKINQLHPSRQVNWIQMSIVIARDCIDRTEWKLLIYYILRCCLQWLTGYYYVLVLRYLRYLHYPSYRLYPVITSNNQILVYMCIKPLQLHWEWVCFMANFHIICVKSVMIHTMLQECCMSGHNA